MGEENKITTLEQAQEKILELTEQVDSLTVERDTLSQNNKQLTTDLENSRTLVQKYFNKLIAQETPQNDDGDDDEEEIQTCEDFAKTLNII